MKSRGQADRRQEPALALVVYSASSIVQAGSVAAVQGQPVTGVRGSGRLPATGQQPGKVAAVGAGEVSDRP